MPGRPLVFFSNLSEFKRHTVYSSTSKERRDPSFSRQPHFYYYFLQGQGQKLPFDLGIAPRIICIMESIVLRIQQFMGTNSKLLRESRNFHENIEIVVYQFYVQHPPRPAAPLKGF
jgi:hypothetical protein